MMSKIKDLLISIAIFLVIMICVWSLWSVWALMFVDVETTVDGGNAEYAKRLYETTIFHWVGCPMKK